MSALPRYLQENSSATWSSEEIVLPTPTPAQTLLFSVEAQNVEQWETLEARVFSFRSLGNDWDGEGALAPKPEVVNTAIDFVRLLKRNEQFYQFAPTQLSIDPTGAIIFEWRVGSVYADAEISGPRTVEWMISTVGLKTRHEIQNL